MPTRDSIYANGFDAETTGQLPANWSVYYTDTGTAVVDASTKYGATGKSMKLTSSSYQVTKSWYSGAKDGYKGQVRVSARVLFHVNAGSSANTDSLWPANLYGFQTVKLFSRAPNPSLDNAILTSGLTLNLMPASYTSSEHVTPANGGSLKLGRPNGGSVGSEILISTNPGDEIQWERWYWVAMTQDYIWVFVEIQDDAGRWLKSDGTWSATHCYCVHMLNDSANMGEGAYIQNVEGYSGIGCQCKTYNHGNPEFYFDDFAVESVPQDIYVNSETGDDANNGWAATSEGASGDGPKRFLQDYHTNSVIGNYFHNGHARRIHMAAGTYPCQAASESPYFMLNSICCYPGGLTFNPDGNAVIVKDAGSQQRVMFIGGLNGGLGMEFKSIDFQPSATNTSVSQANQATYDNNNIMVMFNISDDATVPYANREIKFTNCGFHPDVTKWGGFFDGFLAAVKLTFTNCTGLSSSTTGAKTQAPGTLHNATAGTNGSNPSSICSSADIAAGLPGIVKMVNCDFRSTGVQQHSVLNIYTLMNGFDAGFNPVLNYQLIALEIDGGTFIGAGEAGIANGWVDDGTPHPSSWGTHHTTINNATIQGGTYSVEIGGYSNNTEVTNCHLKGGSVNGKTSIYQSYFLTGTNIHGNYPKGFLRVGATDGSILRIAG